MLGKPDIWFTTAPFEMLDFSGSVLPLLDPLVLAQVDDVSLPVLTLVVSKTLCTALVPASAPDLRDVVLNKRVAVGAVENAIPLDSASPRLPAQIFTLPTWIKMVGSYARRVSTKMIQGAVTSKLVFKGGWNGAMREDICGTVGQLDTLSVEINRQSPVPSFVLGAKPVPAIRRLIDS